MAEYNINVNLRGNVSGGAGGEGVPARSAHSPEVAVREASRARKTQEQEAKKTNAQLDKNNKLFAGMGIMMGRMGVVMGRVENHGAASATASVALLAVMNEFMDTMRPLFRMLLLPIRIIAAYVLKLIASAGGFKFLGNVAGATNDVMKGITEGDWSGITKTGSDVAGELGRDPNGFINTLARMVNPIYAFGQDIAKGAVAKGGEFVDWLAKGVEWWKSLGKGFAAAEVGLDGFNRAIVGASDPENKIWGSFRQTIKPGEAYGEDIWGDWHTTIAGALPPETVMQGVVYNNAGAGTNYGPSAGPTLYPDGSWYGLMDPNWNNPAAQVAHEASMYTPSWGGPNSESGNSASFQAWVNQTMAAVANYQQLESLFPNLAAMSGSMGGIYATTGDQDLAAQYRSQTETQFITDALVAAGLVAPNITINVASVRSQDDIRAIADALDKYYQSRQRATTSYGVQG